MLDDDGRLDRKANGANFQITVEGKTRSYRDRRETALEAGIFLKERPPASEFVEQRPDRHRLEERFGLQP